MERLQAFLSSPEGAAAISGAVRAILTVAVGLGVGLTQEQADEAVKAATAAILVMNVVMSFFTVKTVQTRSDQEEIDAAVSGMVTESNNTEPSPEA